MANVELSQGVWAQVLAEPTGKGRRAALFLDRDGVINEDVGYLCRAGDVRLIPGAADVIARANGFGVPVVVVTNQAGIAYGYFGWDALIAVQDRIVEELAAAGARLDGVFACPYHATGKPPYRHPDHPARKPNPGMLLLAADMLALDLGASWIVGDHAKDLEAGRNAGLAGGLHVLTGHGAHDGQREAAMAIDGFRTLGADSIADAPTLVPLLKE